MEVGGYDIFEDANKAKRLIGYLPEQPPLYMNETPLEYLRFVGEAKGLRGADLDLQITEQFGGKETFVRQDQQLRQAEDQFPQDVTIQQGWRQIDSNFFFRMVYQLSDGRWGESNWFAYRDGPWEFIGWDWLSGPPDLTEYEFYYPAA